jgi:hypothetical protein
MLGVFMLIIVNYLLLRCYHYAVFCGALLLDLAGKAFQRQTL